MIQAFRATKILSTVGADILLTLDFRATKILSTVGVDIPVNHSFQTYKNPFKNGNWHSCHLWLSELSKSCQVWGLAFLLPIVLRATKICQEWQMTFLLPVVFRDPKILSTVEINILVDCNFQSYQNLANSELFLELLISCKNLQLTFLSIVAFRTIKILPTVEVDMWLWFSDLPKSCQ